MASISLRNFKTISPLKLAYNLLVLSGLMDQEGHPWRLIIIIYHLIVLILLCTLSAVQFYSELDNLFEMLQPFTMFIAGVHLLAKYVNLLVNQTKIRILINSLEQFRQQELEDPLYAGQITKTDNFIKTMVYYLNLCFRSYPFLALVFHYINDYLSAAENPTLSLPLWIPWNYQKSWPYVAAVTVSTLLALTGISVYATFNSLLLTFSFEMSSLLKVLQAKMEVTKANDKSIFLQHTNMLQSLQQINELFSGQYYLELLASSAQPCAFCYMIMESIKTGDLRSLDLMYKLFVALLAPLMMCVFGEEMNSQIEKLHECSYRGSWYEEQPAARKDLLILMTVTSRPLTFNYRGLITFNLMCYATVMQAFYSYTTMLTNLMSD